MNYWVLALLRSGSSAYVGVESLARVRGVKSFGVLEGLMLKGFRGKGSSFSYLLKLIQGLLV